jgi:cytochrome c-type biogenesis protein CcmE
MKTRNLVLLGLLAVVAAIMLYGMLQNTGSFTNFQGARTSTSEAHVLAEWVRREEARYDPDADQFFFYLRDSTQHTQLVRYDDPKPINLDQAEKVYIVGQYDGDVFHAKKIYMKCPSKYEETSVSGAQADSRSL